MNANRNLWTEQEDIVLIDLVKKVGPTHGSKKAAAQLGRTHIACTARWCKVLRPRQEHKETPPQKTAEKSTKGITVTTNANGGITIFIPLN